MSSQRDTIAELEKQLSSAKQSATKRQKGRDFSSRAKAFDSGVTTKWKDRTRKSKDVRQLTDHFKAICGGSVEKRAPLLSALARKVGLGNNVFCKRAEWKRLQTYKYIVEQRIRPVIQELKQCRTADERNSYYVMMATLAPTPAKLGDQGA